VSTGVAVSTTVGVAESSAVGSLVGVSAAVGISVALGVGEGETSPGSGVRPVAVASGLAVGVVSEDGVGVRVQSGVAVSNGIAPSGETPARHDSARTEAITRTLRMDTSPPTLENAEAGGVLAYKARARRGAAICSLRESKAHRRRARIYVYVLQAPSSPGLERMTGAQLEPGCPHPGRCRPPRAPA
jgi:hypothetical protein